MLVLTFSKALLIFVLLFTTLGFIISTLKFKVILARRTPKLNIFTHNYITRILLATTTVLLIYVFVRTQLQGALYKISTEYIILMTISLSLILICVVKTRIPSSTLFLLLLFGTVLLLSHIRISDLFFAERSQALYAIIKYHYWDVHWHYISPFYNPLPTDLTLTAFIHYISGLHFIEDSGLRLLIFDMALILALMLNVLILLRLFVGRRSTENWVAVVIVLMMILLTPYLNPICHAAKYLAALSVIMLTYLVTRSVIENVRDFSSYALMIVLIIHAILTHGSGFIVPILFSIALTVHLISISRLKNMNSSLRVIRRILVVALLILAFKVIYTYGVLRIIEQGLPSLGKFIQSVSDLIEGHPQTPHRSLYNVFVKPYYAVSWALLPGLTTGFAVSMLFNRRERRASKSQLALTLWLAGSFILGLGYLFYYSGGSYATLYPACLLLTPLAALRLSRSKLGIIMCAFLLISVAPIALKDPMLNPAVYRTLNPMNNAANTADYIEAKFLTLYVTSSSDIKYWLLESRLAAPVSVLVRMHDIKNLPRNIGSSLSWKLYEELQFKHKIEPYILYVFKPDLLLPLLESVKNLINVVYFSQRTLALYEAQD